MLVENIRKYGGGIHGFSGPSVGAELLQAPPFSYGAVQALAIQRLEVGPPPGGVPILGGILI